MAKATVKVKTVCTARLVYSAGGHRPRFCNRPGEFVLTDAEGSKLVRCKKHARGRGQPLVQCPECGTWGHSASECDAD